MSFSSLSMLFKHVMPLQERHIGPHFKWNLKQEQRAWHCPEVQLHEITRNNSSGAGLLSSIFGRMYIDVR